MLSRAEKTTGLFLPLPTNRDGKIQKYTLRERARVASAAMAGRPGQPRSQSVANQGLEAQSATSVDPEAADCD